MKPILAYLEWSHWPDNLSGGPIWILRLNSTSETVPLVRYQPKILQSPLTSTGMARSPWTQVHTDFAGPFLGKMYLILIDAHSKWMKVHVTSTATSAVTINKMKLTFSSLGLPEILVMDNRPAFSRQEFTASVKANGIRHATCVPYHPASNDLARGLSRPWNVLWKSS